MRGLKRLLLPMVLVASAICLWSPATSSAEFGFQSFSVDVTAEGGSAPFSVAGGHPYSFVTEVDFNREGASSDGDLRDLTVDLPPGFIENPSVVTRCGPGLFAAHRDSPFEESRSGESCPDMSQVGAVTLETSRGGGEERTFGLFNLLPPVGAPYRLGFAPYGVPLVLTPHVRESSGEFGVSLNLRNFTQQYDLRSLKFEIWGVPWSIAHDTRRGNCLNELDPELGRAKCPIRPQNPDHDLQAYLTLPTTCGGPLRFEATATAWGQTGSVSATDSEDPVEGCGDLPFAPVPTGSLSTNRTTTPTGFVFTLDGNSNNLLFPPGRASSQVRRAVVTLPEGMTVNPAVAGGLVTCSEAQFAAETVASPPGAGCPNASKIGELRVDSPLAEGEIEGSMFFAEPYENRFGTLLALYLVAKSPERGILVKVAGKVLTDPGTGQMTATFDDLPQLPYSHLDVRFRASQRSPMATPPTCGTYTARIDLAPWQDPSSVRHFTSEFKLGAGVGGGPCPAGGFPFAPAAAGGAVNPSASAYSPFYLHLTRNDAEQEITSYSATLPPGLLGRLAGIPYCPEEAIAAAQRQSGAESQLAPACPAASLIGHTYTGYGVGATPAYVPGTLYLAGPYHGAPLSIVAIDSAKVGPFDLGTVVIRSAIRIERQTAQVSIDSAASDPIPHILAGIPLQLRDIRIYIDRPGFMVNPTNCAPLSLVSDLTGAGSLLSSPSDDASTSVTSPFQVSNCSALGFAPRLAISMRGGHKRGDHPALRAVVTPRAGDANIGAATVTLSPKVFLAQENLDTVCTPKQFAAHTCPRGSIYGRATAITPLLGEPMTGPVYLRTNNSERDLPDLVAAIAGRGIEIDVLGKIDSHHGGLRARFDRVPDAPLTKFTMNLFGGRRGILSNATDICVNPQVGSAKFRGADDAVHTFRVPLRAKCKAKKGRR